MNATSSFNTIKRLSSFVGVLTRPSSSRRLVTTRKTATTFASSNYAWNWMKRRLFFQSTISKSGDCIDDFMASIRCFKPFYQTEALRAFSRKLPSLLHNFSLVYILRYGSYDYALERNMRKYSIEDIDRGYANFLAGFTAGVFEATVLMTSSQHLPHQAGNDFFQKLYRFSQHNRIISLWKGNSLNAARHGGVQCFNFMTHVFLDSHIWGKSPIEQGKMIPYKTFLDGMIVGSLSPIYSNPIDAVKQRMSTQRYSSFYQSLKQIIRTEGVASLWKGYMQNARQSALPLSITWTIMSELYAL